MRMSLYNNFRLYKYCLNQTRIEKDTTRNLNKKTTSIKQDIKSNNNELAICNVYIFRNTRKFQKLMLALLFTMLSLKHEMKILKTKDYEKLKSLNKYLNTRFLNEIKKEILIDFSTEFIYYALIYISIIKSLSRSISIVRYFSLKITLIFIKKHNKLLKKSEEILILELLFILSIHQIYILLKQYLTTSRTR